MQKSAEKKFIVLETIYGGGNSIVGILKRLQTEFDSEKSQFIICHSEDAVRAEHMGVDSSIHPGMPSSAKGKAYLELAARAELCTSVIEPALSLGKLVICKNFTLSSLIGFELNCPDLKKELSAIEKRARNDIEPDLTIFIDWTAEENFEHMLSLGITPPREMWYYQKQRDLYLKKIDNLPKSKSWVVAPAINNDATWQVLEPFFVKTIKK